MCIASKVSQTRTLLEISQFIFSGTQFIINLITDEEFTDLIYAQSRTKKSTYSRASILNTNIPVIVILAHDLGLTKAMTIAGIKYDISEKKNKDLGWDYIKLSDCYINYEVTYDSLMLMNGLKDCNTEDYSIAEINSKMTWVSILDNFGGRIKSDGLDNFKDLMFDPITAEVCVDYDLPDNYHEALVYASNLLVDNKAIKTIYYKKQSGVTLITLGSVEKFPFSFTSVSVVGFLYSPFIILFFTGVSALFSSTALKGTSGVGAFFLLMIASTCSYK